MRRFIVTKEPEGDMSAARRGRPWWGDADWLEWHFFQQDGRLFARVRSNMTLTEYKKRLATFYAEKHTVQAELFQNGIQRGKSIWYEVIEDEQP